MDVVQTLKRKFDDFSQYVYPERGFKFRRATWTRSKYYHDSGDLMIAVGTTLFKVHRSHLKSHFGVMRDGFVDNFLILDGSMEGGFPVYRLAHGDPSVEEVNVLFEGIYHGIRYEEARTTQGIVENIFPLIRLGSIYRITSASFEDALKIIQPFFPHRTHRNASFAFGRLREMDPEFHSASLRLIIQAGLKSLLPSAILFCCQRPAGTILNDASIPLSYRTLCIAAQDNLRAAQREHMYKMFNHITPCLTNGCISNKYTRLDSINLLGGLEKMDRDPLYTWEFQQWKETGLCSACIKQEKKRFEAGKALIWETLPEILKLGTWEELEDEEKEMVSNLPK
ncbi:hypothetical protein VKT23_004925 [Stygiomarasmius scandens]|uniref:BTB domain-containing protein n=1 Tax=Marasmiellus scandens TaxID=2682957 RepID=A0ABR1JW71_9AGAR